MTPSGRSDGRSSRWTEHRRVRRVEFVTAAVESVRRTGPARVILAGIGAAADMAESHLSENDRDSVVAGRVTEPHRLTEAVVAHDATDVLLFDVTAFGSVYPEPLNSCLLYTSPSPRDRQKSRMPSSA